MCLLVREEERAVNCCHGTKIKAGCVTGDGERSIGCPGRVGLAGIFWE